MIKLNVTWSRGAVDDEPEAVEDGDDLWQITLLVVFATVVSPVIVFGNGLVVMSVLRFKRLRTPSNYLIVSLATSDIGMGLALPCGVYSCVNQNPYCLLIYCICILLGCASVIFMTSIAVDRFMSLSQPLRYKFLITHVSILRCLPFFWIYSFLLGFAPAMYHGTLIKPLYVSRCSFPMLVDSRLQLILLWSVYGPCCSVLIYCYAYTYTVARHHAKAICTVEVSVSGSRVKQLTVSRYGRTLALTVGCFVVLWLPFQCCVILDLLQGSKIIAGWREVILSLPIFLSSAVNPWVYGFRNTELRADVLKLLTAIFGIERANTEGGAEMALGDAEAHSFGSNIRFYARSPYNTQHLLLAPKHVPANNTSVLEVPDIHIELVVTSQFVNGQEMAKI